jgi:adenosylhomocysteinase
LAIAELKKGDVKDIGLADGGKRKIEWAAQQMPVLEIIRKRFAKEQPLKGMRVSACLHVTSETANLMITLRDGGAEVVLCASNPLSTQDEVAASLNRHFNIPTYAIKGEDNQTYYSHLGAALEHKPQFTMDDGADLVTMLLTKRTDSGRRYSGDEPAAGGAKSGHRRVRLVRARRGHARERLGRGRDRN